MSINKTNTNIPFIHHESIEEWDIRSANTSLMRYYKLANPKLIEKFEKMEKQYREPAVGLYLRKNKDCAVALEKAFTDIINEFLLHRLTNPISPHSSIQTPFAFNKCDPFLW